MAWEQLAPQVITRLSKDLQLTPTQAAGIVGQLGYESDGLQAINERNPTVPGSRGGFGWAQWTGPRRKAFESWAAENRADVADPEANYQFLLHELKDTPEGRVLPALRAAPDAQAAGRLFTDRFLRPGVPAYDSRASWTQKALDFILPAAQAGELPQNGPWVKYAQQSQPATEGPWTKYSRKKDQAPIAEQRDINTSEGRRALVEDSLRSPFDNSTPAEGTMALGAGLGQGVGQVALGAQHWLGRGLQELGAEQAGQWLTNNASQGRESLNRQAAPYADAAPFSAAVGRIGGNVAATIPATRMLGGVVSALPWAARLGRAIQTGGANLGGIAPTSTAQLLGNLLTRSTGGALSGAAQAGLVNPDDVSTGAAIGGSFPVAGQAVASSAKALGAALRGGPIADNVISLANRAKQLGIDIPADRIANSRPMNAVASSLEYVPFSGRTATLDKMQGQFNRAISRTFGQDSDNVTMALRNASNDLGEKFDRVLRGNAVRADDQLLDDLAQAAGRASNELEAGQARIITNQIDEILNKAQDGVIDGQAAYNIKRTLDRIGKRNSPEGFYADDLRKILMDALNRSLGQKKAQDFAKIRSQYGNMLTLRRYAQNGVDGDVSIARIANMRDIRNPELQELADIAAQFLKPREGAHGAAQRVVAGGAAAVLGGPAALGAAIGAGRGTNMLLNNGTIRNAMLRQPTPENVAIANALRQTLPVTSRFAPVLAAQ